MKTSLSIETSQCIISYILISRLNFVKYLTIWIWLYKTQGFKIDYTYSTFLSSIIENTPLFVCDQTICFVWRQYIPDDIYSLLKESHLQDIEVMMRMMRVMRMIRVMRISRMRGGGEGGGGGRGGRRIRWIRGSFRYYCLWKMTDPPRNANPFSFFEDVWRLVVSQ